MKRALPLLILLFAATIAKPQASITITKTMSYGGALRDYLVHLPTGFNVNQPLPVVFNLHGSGVDAASQEFYSSMSDTADNNSFIVVYPDGIGNEWNVGFTGTYGTGTDDVGFISKIIDTLHSMYNIDLNRVYTCGMSDGGFMSYRLACELSDRIAAMASVSGTLSDSVAYYCNPARHMPILHIHGTADPLVLYNGDTGYYGVEQTVNFWKNKELCDNTSDTTVVPDIDIHDSSNVIRIHYGNCTPGTQVVYYKIIGGGHTWPNTTFPYIYGPTNHDIDGSGIIWNFFKQYSLNGTTGIPNETPGTAELKVFPNPTEGELHITSTAEIISAQLFDVNGLQLLEKKPEQMKCVLSLDNYPKGVYLLKVLLPNSQQTFKLIK